MSAVGEPTATARRRYVEGEVLLAVYGVYRRVPAGAPRAHDGFEDEPWELVFFSREDAEPLGVARGVGARGRAAREEAREGPLQRTLLRTTWRATTRFEREDEGTITNYSVHASVRTVRRLVTPVAWTSAPTFAVDVATRDALHRRMGRRGTTGYSPTSQGLWVGDPWPGECVSTVVLVHPHARPTPHDVEAVGVPHRASRYGFARDTHSGGLMPPPGYYGEAFAFRRIAGMCVAHEDCLDNVELAQACAGEPR